MPIQVFFADFLLVLFNTEHKNCLYILDTNTLSDIVTANMFSQTKTQICFISGVNEHSMRGIFRFS